MNDQEIIIDNLTNRQLVFADILWELESAARVESFIASLPPMFQDECRTVAVLMHLAVVDASCDRSDDLRAARSAILKVARS
jgi:hypothetical protein